MSETETPTFGCDHYSRGCRIFAPCCSKWYGCRHCHNEDIENSHRLDPKTITTMECYSCKTAQPTQGNCTSCQMSMGTYYCAICHLFDNASLEKGIFHCTDCGICRIGGRDNFYHCLPCGACLANELRTNHKCVSDSTRQDCPICLEYMFDAREESRILRCGHAMHSSCFAKVASSR